jgi:hypothetical protein
LIEFIDLADDCDIFLFKKEKKNPVWGDPVSTKGAQSIIPQTLLKYIFFLNFRGSFF